MPRSDVKADIHRNKIPVLEHNIKLGGLDKIDVGQVTPAWMQIQASGDAAVDIVETAVSSSLTKSTTLIGEDTGHYGINIRASIIPSQRDNLKFVQPASRINCHFYSFYPVLLGSGTYSISFTET